MQITSADTIQLRIPFSDPGKGEGLFPGTWNALDFVLLRLETDSGLVGWGEAFSYFCADAVAALTRQSVAPLLLGKNPRAIEPILAELRRKLHIIGRYGITMFAISAADIALWDLDAKAEGVSLADRLGGRRRADVPAYASLIRYADSSLVREIAGRAVAEGYRTVKLHEIAPEHIRAGREAVGPGIALTNDVNCNWTVEQTLAWAPELRALDLMWLEEPIFPPEDFATLARLRRDTGLAIATGENACTEYQFAEMIAAGAADYVQPSVTKIGGISETMATRARAAAAGVRVAQHAPYFGPGYLATLQIQAASPEEELFEYLYIDREAELFPGMPVPRRGRVAIPDGPGLGLDPDPGVIARYRVA
jgi:L-alanine-DL-glutamate epimerase-like enolase superfamily enzyme